jgi:hypothetical protein
MENIDPADVKLVKIKPSGAEGWQAQTYDEAGAAIGDASSVHADRATLVNTVGKLFPQAAVEISPRAARASDD